jgi:uncharacterized membrane protein YeaQ/YmgE (transglycosylase-associated protein family)
MPREFISIALIGSIVIGGIMGWLGYLFFKSEAENKLVPLSVIAALIAVGAATPDVYTEDTGLIIKCTLLTILGAICGHYLFFLIFDRHHTHVD